ncbi:response regulator transcription factor [Kribbella sp. NPDC005582]|uniref:response regulator transcription factor n=1 Tax=Kribbella sp. NPDC005582 TaxID=3156893 RepID=UPI0033B3B72F
MRVVIADDAVILREGVARLLTEAGFEIAGLAADADELLELVATAQPEVAIIDIRMPPTFTDEGLRAARTIRERWPRVGILILSQHVQASYAVELLAAGTEGIGYLLKDRVGKLDELAASIRTVATGGSVLDPSVVTQLVADRRRADDPVDRLTARELDVLSLMAQGLTNKAIADRLFISEHTVEKHVGSILSTLQISATADDHRRVLAVITYLDGGRT